MRTIEEITIQDFGLADYEVIWELQKSLVQKRLAGEIQDTLLLGEHLPVITLGRGSHSENLLNPNIPVLAVERGGDVTYHGPGQLISYPIMMLPEEKRDLHRYLRSLEEVIICTLGRLGLQGERNPGWTGVWVREPGTGRLLKIASIGVAVKSWVTYHGLAFNVSTDLTDFRQINPCGLDSTLMTSLAALGLSDVSTAQVKALLVECFGEVDFFKDFAGANYSA